jgi:hypothetical protein
MTTLFVTYPGDAHGSLTLEQDLAFGGAHISSTRTAPTATAC